MGLSEKILELLSNGDINEAFELILKFKECFGNNIRSLIMSNYIRFKELSRENYLGVLPEQTFHIERNKILNFIVEVVIPNAGQKLKEESFDTLVDGFYSEANTFTINHLKNKYHIDSFENPVTNLFFVLSQLAGKSLSSTQVSRKEIDFFRNILVISAEDLRTREIALCLLMTISYDFFDRRRISTLPSTEDYVFSLKKIPITKNRKILKIIILSNHIIKLLNI